VCGFESRSGYFVEHGFLVGDVAAGLCDGCRPVASDVNPLDLTNVRTVNDQRGVTWICLELPEIPAEHRASAAGLPTGTVAVECNSGAQRAIVLVAEGWDESLDDLQLTAAIEAKLA
jgi:hypothetical protein